MFTRFPDLGLRGERPGLRGVTGVDMGEPEGDWDEGISKTLRFSGVESRPNLDFVELRVEDVVYFATSGL